MSREKLSLEYIKKQAKIGAIVIKDMSGESQPDDQRTETSSRPPLEFGREHGKFVERVLATLKIDMADVTHKHALSMDYIKKQTKIGVIVIKDTSGGSHQDYQRIETSSRPQLVYADEEAHGRFAEKVLATRYE